MADTELFSSTEPRLGTAAGVALNGVASLTPSVDTLGFNSVLALTVTTTAILYADIVFSFEHSDDDVTFAAVPANYVVYRAPDDVLATSQVFHAAYIGKKQYVKARAQTTLGTELGQVTILLGHARSVPFYGEEIES